MYRTVVFFIKKSIIKYIFQHFRVRVVFKISYLIFCITFKSPIIHIQFKNVEKQRLDEIYIIR